jgi:alpha-glucosidase
VVNEFLFGADLLVAPPPQLEQTEPYEVQFPSGGWYDYWTGARVAETAANTSPMVKPALAELPVYVRPGTILPYAPLTQSTQEQPRGPLTLRVYPGADCHGSIYSDDGHTFAYRRGEFLRMKFTCSLNADGSLALHVGPHEGTYPAWWSDLHLQIFGLTVAAPRVQWGDRSVSAEVRAGAVEVTIPDDGKGLDLTVHGHGKP